MSAFWDYFAIGLEIIAFFLVTTDLYGEKGLRSIHDKIKGTDVNGGMVIINLMVRTRYLGILLFIGTLATFFWLLIKMPYHFAFLDNHTVVKYIAFAIADVAATMAFLLVFYFVLFAFIAAVSLGLEICIKILQSKPLKHYMLFVGAFLFLLSKVISIVKIHLMP